jgi:hypothetical protein
MPVPPMIKAMSDPDRNAISAVILFTVVSQVGLIAAAVAETATAATSATAGERNLECIISNLRMNKYRAQKGSEMARIPLIVWLWMASAIRTYRRAAVSG